MFFVRLVKIKGQEVFCGKRFENMKTKCPQCGKVLTENDILISVYSLEGKLIDCFHTDYRIWNMFINECKENGLEPNEVFFKLIKGFMKKHG